jgi:hypothetical protein
MNVRAETLTFSEQSIDRCKTEGICHKNIFVADSKLPVPRLICCLPEEAQLSTEKED